MKNSQEHLVWIRTSPFENLGIPTWLFTTHELRKAGWKVTLISPGKTGKHEKLGVEYVGIPMPNIYLLRQLIFNFRVLAYISHLSQKPDVIMFHENSVPIFFLEKFIRQILGKRRPLFVLDTRSLPMQPTEIASWKDRLRGRYFFIVNWVANRMAVDGRVTITQPMAQALQIPEDKLWGIWTSGVQLEMFSDAPKMRNWQDIHNQVDLIYIGSMSDGRNLVTFGQAVIDANQQGMKITMTFIGEGSEMNDLLHLEKTGGGCIRVIPSVPHDQIQNWLAQAHVGVLPFPDEVKFRVSSPIKMFEYAASGLVILATKIECHTGVIGNGKYVIWAKGSTVESFVESLKEIWEARDILIDRGKQAEKAAPQWTWARSASNLGKALHQGIIKYG